jgi:epoxide hydrolase-like predicted phosphatase
MSQLLRPDSPFQAVIFDYGNVLSLEPNQISIERMAAIFSLDVPRFLSYYFEVRDPLDRGDISAENYWQQIAGLVKVHLPADAIHSLRRWDVRTWSDLNPAMLAWVASLKKAGYTIGLLSNMHADMAQHLRANSSLLSKFDHLTISYEIRRVKPELEIYHHSLHGLGVAPDSALFIDDRKANVEAARQLGITAIQFESEARLLSELDRIGFPLLPTLNGTKTEASSAI